MAKFHTALPPDYPLPKDIKVSDVNYIPQNWKIPKKRILHTLDFYYTERFGWVIATLHIRNASRRMQGSYYGNSLSPRTYAITLSGQLCRVGLGPHVKARATVYVTEGRKEALQKYVVLASTGADKANDVRDAISTRRMRSTLRRDPMGGY